MTVSSGDDQEKVVPRWLRPIAGAKFYSSCETHRFKERNYYCRVCMVAFCKDCKKEHDRSKHEILTVMMSTLNRLHLLSIMSQWILCFCFFLLMGFDLLRHIKLPTRRRLEWRTWSCYGILPVSARTLSTGGSSPSYIRRALGSLAHAVRAMSWSVNLVSMGLNRQALSIAPWSARWGSSTSFWQTDFFFNVFRDVKERFLTRWSFLFFNDRLKLRWRGQMEAKVLMGKQRGSWRP